MERLNIAGMKVIALPTNPAYSVHENFAQYNVTDRDVVKVVKFAARRGMEERANQDQWMG